MIASASTRVVALVALLAGTLLLSLGAASPAPADSCNKVKVGNFKVKKIRASEGLACGDARRVGKLWVKRDYDDFNPIHVGSNRWFCSWRRRAPKSLTTGTAECDADPGEEVNFAVRKRR